MKVAIIGAGISGLYLGWKLTEKGEEVTIFEKKGRIGKEVCSGLFSERILNFIPESEKLIQNQIDFCLIHWAAGRDARASCQARRAPVLGWRPKQTLKIKFSRKFFVMSHYELDNLVSNLAEKAGAKIILNHSTNSFPEGFDKIIGCDGANSFVRRFLRLPEPTFRLAIQGFVSQKDNSDFVETWPVQDGFLWKIPRGDKIEYGIIEKPERARILFEEFLKEKGIQLPEQQRRVKMRIYPHRLPEQQRRVKMRIYPHRLPERSEGWRRTNVLRLEKINSAPVPQGLIIPKNPKITLCGDSAGLTKPWSGGGVIWGLIAADLLLKNFPDFLKYQKAVEKFFLPKIIFSKIAKKLIYFLGFNFPWLIPKNIKIESDFLI